MNCPRCNSSDYYDGMFGGNCVNNTCSLFKGGKVLGNEVFNSNFNIDWSSIVEGYNSDNRWNLEFNGKPIELWIWRRKNISCWEVRGAGVCAIVNDADLLDLFVKLRITYDPYLHFKEEEVKKYVEIILNHFQVDPADYYPRPF